MSIIRNFDNNFDNKKLFNQQNLNFLDQLEALKKIFIKYIKFYE